MHRSREYPHTLIFVASSRSCRLSGCWPILPIGSPKKLLPIGSECAPWVHVAIERLATDAEFGAKLADLRPGLAHRRLGEPQLRCRHLERLSAVAAAGAGRREPRSGALDDQFAFELSQGGAMN